MLSARAENKRLSSRGENGNAIVLVAVVDFSHGNSDGRQQQVRKVRFFRRQGSERPYTGRQVYKAIVGDMNNQTVRSSDRIFCHETHKVEIYDKDKGEFVSLLGPDVHGANVVKKFGSRVRCQITELLLPSSETSTPLLTIEGRFYSYNDKDGIEVAGKRIVIREMANQHGTGTGVNVWDGAILLVRYLEQNQELVKGKRVLELGSGCGMVGIAAGMLGAGEVVLTDLPYVLPLLTENVHGHKKQLSKCRRITCAECDWFRPCTMSELGPEEGRNNDSSSWQADVLLLADCVWLHELVAPLLHTISTLLDDAVLPVTIIISYQQRGKSTHEAFIRGLHTMFSSVVELQTSVTKPDSLSLIECRRLYGHQESTSG